MHRFFDAFDCLRKRMLCRKCYCLIRLMYPKNESRIVVDPAELDDVSAGHFSLMPLPLFRVSC
jgi:hypothetical protein